MLAPIIAIALLRQTGGATAVAVYVAVAAALTLSAVYFARETRGTFAEIDAEAPESLGRTGRESLPLA